MRTRIHEFRIVTISREEEPNSALGVNRCSHRAYMAKLLNRIASDTGPRLIVIDKWYNKIPPEECTQDPNPTEQLRTAIQNLSAKVTVVIGLASYNHDEIKQFCEKVVPEKFDISEMVMADYERLDLSAGDAAKNPEGGRCKQRTGQIRFGLVRANLDIRKVPLAWPLYCDCPQPGGPAPQLWPTLSTVAADVLDPSIMRDRGLAKLKEDVHHPYVHLVPEEEGDPEERFQHIPAKQIVDGDKKALEELNHRLVIIGEPWTDIHKTEDGMIDGPTLQANYIAALLSEDTLKPVGQWARRTASIAWLAVIFGVFYCWKRTEHRPALALGISVALTLAFAVSFSLVLTRQFGFYADVIAPTFLEIMGLYLARKIEVLIEPHGSH